MAVKLVFLFVILWALTQPITASAQSVQTPGSGKATIAVRAALLWKDVLADSLPTMTKWDTVLHWYRIVKLKESALHQLLQQWQSEKYAERGSKAQIVLPIPDHSWAVFHVMPTKTLAEGTTSLDHFSIHTFSGDGLDNVYSGVAFEITPGGFHAMVTMGDKTIFIQPVGQEYPALYICYYKHFIKQGNRVPFEAFGPLKPIKGSLPQ